MTLSAIAHDDGASRVASEKQGPDRFVTELRKKPLVEAILEVRWAATGGAARPFASVDESYSLLVGSFFDRVKTAYPFHERLPTAQLPDQLIAHLAQHRFRVGPADWPLIQLGPGLLTLNETSKYTWTEFRDRATDAIRHLLEAHPEPSHLRNLQVTLRYLDAIPFDLRTENVLDFLGSKLQLRIGLPESLFANLRVSSEPAEFVWQCAFRTQSPVGALSLKIGLGEKDGVTAVILDTAIISAGEEAPKLASGFAAWADAAHAVTSAWFKGLTAGDLYESFEPI
jgi:uncharacterized protein (TIGR04255 family)